MQYKVSQSHTTTLIFNVSYKFLHTELWLQQKSIYINYRLKNRLLVACKNLFRFSAKASIINISNLNSPQWKLFKRSKHVFPEEECGWYNYVFCFWTNGMFSCFVSKKEV